METQNKDKTIGVFVYEMLGTAFIMTAFIISSGDFGGAALSTTVVMMCIAYNVSGGHFNPAITVGMFIAGKDIKGNLKPLILMIVAQFVGAFLGILFGFLAVIDSDYQEQQAGSNHTVHAKVPTAWVNFEAFLPIQADGEPDTGVVQNPDGTYSNDAWTRDWQTFWATLMSSIILILAFISIKHKDTQLTDNGLIQILAIWIVLSAVTALNSKYGACGWNPALACGYISFAVSQHNYPNTMDDSTYKRIHGFEQSDKEVNHYLWVYMVAPFVGAVIAGILHLIHSKCSNVKGRDNDEKLEEFIE